MSSLLAGYPKLAGRQSLAAIPAETSAAAVTLPAASGAPVTLGPGMRTWRAVLWCLRSRTGRALGN